MNELTARELSVADVSEIRRLAGDIWHRVYNDLLSREQLVYMLDWMYGEDQLITELFSPHMQWWFFEMNSSTDPIGYAAGCPGEAEGEWHLHKFYLHPKHHGQGLGSRGLQWLIQNATHDGHSEMTLRVNRFNQAANRCYERNGFVRIKEICTDIGHGFVMDDYWMSRRLGG